MTVLLGVAGRACVRGMPFRCLGDSGRSLVSSVLVAQQQQLRITCGTGAHRSTRQNGAAGVVGAVVCRSQQTKASPFSVTAGRWRKAKGTPDGRRVMKAYFAAIASISLLYPFFAWNTSVRRSDRDRLRAENTEVQTDDDTTVEMTNWSNTHRVQTKELLSPESIKELEVMIEEAHELGTPIRVVGSACSPNGIGLSSSTMLSIAQLDKIVNIDTERSQVTVQAGATVGKVVEALRPHGLTLENLASINLQQIGGFVQVGAHGTGATIPPVDEQVVSFKLVTPRLGTMDLNKENKEQQFEMTKVGLGCFGVVSEVTLQCVPAHRLEEKWEVLTREQAKKTHIKRLRNNRHVKYLWYPYVDAVVVVSANKTTEKSRPFANQPKSTVALEPLRALLRSVDTSVTEAEMEGLTLEGLRERVIAVDPFDVWNIRQLNEAEVECRRRCAGTRVADSDAIMAFECGGAQLVDEMALETGTLSKYNGNDMECVTRLMRTVEGEAKIPAPGPIEQRWSSSSNARMSTAPQFPGGSVDVKTPTDATERLLYTWVGIIMYLPYDDDERRGRITRRFGEYKKVLFNNVYAHYMAREHWAKIEEPKNDEMLRKMRKYIDARFPIHEFNKFRHLVDPKGIMATPFTDKLVTLAKKKEE